MPILNSIASWLMKKRMHQIELFIKYPIDVQQEWLFSLLQDAAETEYGKNNDFSSIKNYSQFKEKDMAFSAPLTLSTQDFFQVKQILLEAIEKVSKTVSTSPSEELACLNIDFFSFNKN